MTMETMAEALTQVPAQLRLLRRWRGLPPAHRARSRERALVVLLLAEGLAVALLVALGSRGLLGWPALPWWLWLGWGSMAGIGVAMAAEAAFGSVLRTPAPRLSDVDVTDALYDQKEPKL
jgi:hypothetical protein